MRSRGIRHWPAVTWTGGPRTELLARCWLRVGQPAKALEALNAFDLHSRDPRKWRGLPAGLICSRADYQKQRNQLSRRPIASPRTRCEWNRRLLSARRLVLSATSPSTQPSRQAGTRRRSCPPGNWGTLPGHRARLLTRTSLACLTVSRNRGNDLQAVTTVGNESFKAIVKFALGTGHQGQTFVSHDPGEVEKARELRISRYPRAPEWSRTMDHPAVLPEANLYLGRPLSADAFRRCLSCHSTNFRSMLEPDGHPEARDHAIGCERCHGPAGNHLAAVKAGFGDLAIVRPRLGTAEQVVNLCGELPQGRSDCHFGIASVRAVSVINARAESMLYRKRGRFELRDVS